MIADDSDFWIYLVRFLSIMCIVLGSTNFTVNGLTIYTVLSTPSLRAGKARFYFMLMCLSAGAMSYGVANVSTGVMRFDFLTNGSLSLKPVPQSKCAIVHQFSYLGIAYYQAIMLIIAMERFYSLTFPVNYTKHGATFTERALLATSGVCLAASMLGTIGAEADDTLVANCLSSLGMGPTYYIVYMYIFGTFPGLAATALYVYVWVASKLKMNANKVSAAAAAPTAVIERRHMILTRLVASIIFKYATLCSVAIICMTVPAFPGFLTAWKPLQKTTLMCSSGCLFSLNGLLDPFVYFWRSEDFRKAVIGKFVKPKADAEKHSTSSGLVSISSKL